MTPQLCLLLWPRCHLVRGHSSISQHPIIRTTQPLQRTIPPLCFSSHMEASTLRSNSQTQQSILHHTKIFLPYLPPFLPLQSVREASYKQNRIICSRLPFHLAYTDGGKTSLLCHRCPTKYPLTNECQP
jgi:hypothetical protein